MKSKMYIADINSTITEKFNNVKLLYPQAHKDSTKPGCSITYITEGSEFIAIGKGDETKDELRTFSNWDEAAEYANTLTGEFAIGIRSAGKKQFDIVANAKAEAKNEYEFKYVEATYVDGNEITNTEKTWTADTLNDYNRFRDIWEEMESFNEHYWLKEVGSLIEDGVVSMVLEYTLETDQRETIKFIRGISYKLK